MRDRLGDWMATLNDPLLRGPVSAPEPRADRFGQRLGQGAHARTERRGVPLGRPADARFRRASAGQRQLDLRGFWKTSEVFLVSGVIMARVVVLGAGMVGAAMAADLATAHQVLSVDRDAARLASLGPRFGFETCAADLSRPDVVAEVCRDADLVVGAVPGFMGFETLRTVIEAGKNVVDISFFGEDPFPLDDLAARPRGDRGDGLRRRAGAEQHDPRLSRRPRRGLRVSLPGRRPAGQAHLALAVQGALLARRRARRVHPARPAGRAPARS